MPSIRNARSRYIYLYINVAENACQLYSTRKTQSVGLSVFDGDRGQIDAALEWVTGQRPTNETDRLLARFVDALSPIGIMRYNVPGKLIPLVQREISAAQRLGKKDLEADALDGLGILYAFLGYMQPAIDCFTTALEIADQVGTKELRKEIKIHLKHAQNQIRKDKLAAAPKSLSLIRLIWLRLKLWISHADENPISQVAILNSMASVYLEVGKWDLAIRYYQQAASISQEHSYRFGELDASLGLLQAKMSKEAGGSHLWSADTAGKMINEFGFKWSVDFSVFEALLEIAPTIERAELFANRLESMHDQRAKMIYECLDGIIDSTYRIVSAAMHDSADKHNEFIIALQEIKEGLGIIVKISSETTTQ